MKFGGRPLRRGAGTRTGCSLITFSVAPQHLHSWPRLSPCNPKMSHLRLESTPAQLSSQLYVHIHEECQHPTVASPNVQRGSYRELILAHVMGSPNVDVKLTHPDDGLHCPNMLLPRQSHPPCCSSRQPSALYHRLTSRWQHPRSAPQLLSVSGLASTPHYFCTHLT